MADDPERQLDRLLAESEIRNMVARVGHLADDGEVDEYLTYWAENASWVNADGERFTGHDALRERVVKYRADGVQGPGTDSRHLNTTLWVRLDADGDHAMAESYYLYLRDAKETPTVVRTGRYRDRFVRTSAGWKYLERQLVRDVN